MFSETVGIKVSDDLVLPVMVYWLSRSVLSYLISYAWPVSIYDLIVPAQNVPVAQFNSILFKHGKIQQE